MGNGNSISLSSQVIFLPHGRLSHLILRDSVSILECHFNLSTLIPFHQDDVLIWSKCQTAKYYVKSGYLYCLLQTSQVSLPINFPWDSIWQSCLQSQLKACLWKIAWKRLKTSSLLINHNPNFVDICPFCHSTSLKPCLTFFFTDILHTLVWNHSGWSLRAVLLFLARSCSVK